MTRAKVALALVASGVLVALAIAARPQANIARVLPFAVSAAVLVAWVAFEIGGARRAVRVAGWCLVALAVSVAGYIVAFEPVPHAECGTVVEEIGNAPCIDRSDLPRAVALAGAAAGAAILLVGESRRLTSAQGCSGPSPPPGAGRRSGSSPDRRRRSR